MWISSIKFCLAVCGAAAYSTMFADQQEETLCFDPEQMNILIRQTAMPELGDTRLEKILTNYYLEGLGGAEHWDKVESLRVFGSLTFAQGEYELAAYQKKPDYIKMTIRDQRGSLILGYDGKTAWQQIRNQDAVDMPAAEARRFIHSSHFGNHLLYPFAHGKTVSYVDTVPIEGDICHHLRVTLDTGFQVDYFIDIRTYLEVKVVNLDLHDQSTSSVVYGDYIRDFGMPIAKSVTSYENGEWSSQLELDEVKVNSGIMPWMFKKP